MSVKAGIKDEFEGLRFQSGTSNEEWNPLLHVTEGLSARIISIRLPMLLVNCPKQACTS